MKAVFGKDILSMLKKDRNVWSTDVNYRDVSGKATMTEAETNHVTELLSQAGKIFRRLDAATLNAIKNDDELLQRIKTFNNTKIRARSQITNVKKHVAELIEYINNIYDKEAEAKKTERGKLTAEIKRKRLLSYFTQKNKKSLEDIFEMMNLLAAAKLILVKKLDEVKSVGTFLMTKNGYEVTGAEGFVAIDKLKGNAVKLVDRMQFSYANFSPDIIKGWQR
jgi:phosphoenolpyruvate carboxylase